jgi:hypothetical protein
VGEAVHIVNHPLAYFSSGDVLEAALDDVSAQFFHHAVSYQPTVDPSKFWVQQLAELSRRKQTYSASDQTLAQLRDIVRYCRTHQIEIYFVIPPEHEDVRTRIDDLGMRDGYSAFKSTLAALGPTFDCDIPSEFTRNAANFQDPYHMTPAAGSLMTKSIWSGEHQWCELTRAD